MRTLSIIIPCYNEKGTIRELLDRVFAVQIPEWNIEVVVVDDGSKDGTKDILQSYTSRAVIISEVENKGKGSAVTKGLQMAKGDYFLIQDADLEYDPKEIPSLVAALKDSRSVVYGSRNLRPHARKKSIWIPRFGVWLITRLTNIYHGSRLTDVWTCYKLFPREARPHFVPGGFESEIFFTINLLKDKYSIAEVPISHNPRDWSEGKKITYGDGIRAIWIIITSRPVFFLSVILAFLALFFLAAFPPHIAGDTPSYLEAMDVMQGGVQPIGFVPNRIMTNFLVMNVLIVLSWIFGTYFTGWTLMNIVFYFVTSIFFYKTLRTFFSNTVAILGTLFLATNYAFLTFGFSYLVDAGGWAGYIISLYFLSKYIKSDSKRDLMWCALAIGIGGLFKEYAFLGYVALFVWMIYKHKPQLLTFIKKMIAPTAVVFAPFIAVSIYVYVRYGYTYLSWFGSNKKDYVYHSRIIEYTKSFGSLYTLLAILFLAGLYCFIRYDLAGWLKRKMVDAVHENKDYVPYIICVIVSALPAFIWPAITQRIMFVTVPATIFIACCFIKRFEKYWYWFGIVLIVYAVLSFTMDRYILDLVNLPI